MCIQPYSRGGTGAQCLKCGVRGMEKHPVAHRSHVNEKPVCVCPIATFEFLSFDHGNGVLII